MDKIYCNECGKDVKPVKGKCPNCGLKFNSDLLEEVKTYSSEKNIVSLFLKILSFIIFVVGFVLAVFYLRSFLTMLFIIFISLIIIAFAEIIQICHDIRYKIYKK